MHHGRLPDFWIWCRLFMIDCKYSYMDDTRLDDEDDEQGVHARRVVRKQMNTWSMPSTSKGDTCTCNTKRTPRLSNNLHTLSCGGEAMIHQEHTNHSATLQLDMDTTISMNIPARHVESCHESSRPRHYYGPYCCNLCNVMRKSNTPTYIVEESGMSNSIEWSQRVTRVKFTLGYKCPSFVHANEFSHWLLPHSFESL